MDEIKDLLSQKRLSKYQSVSKEDAVSCHLFNTELAESFYSSLSYFEIILRNKIDIVFSKYLGQDWIFDKKYHIGKNEKHFEDATQRIEREKGASYLKNRDCLISELVFGYWSFLFSPTYKDILWNKYPTMLSEIFDNSKYTFDLYKAYYQINTVRLYRNKVFHYGALIVPTNGLMKPEQMHNMIYAMCRNMGANIILKKIQKIDSFKALKILK